jgi:hypothetical protein
MKHKPIQKGEWSVQFTLKFRTDLGYSCKYIRAFIRKLWPNVKGLSVRRIR